MPVDRWLRSPTHVTKFMYEIHDLGCARPGSLRSSREDAGGPDLGGLAMSTTFHFDRRRRRMLQGAGATAASAALGPLLISERTIAQTRTLYVNSWGGSYTAAQDAA